MRTIYERLVDKFGHDPQLNQLTEECSELLVAVNKLRRKFDPAISQFQYNNNEQLLVNCIEEIVDVKIMLEQLKVILQQKYPDASIERAIEAEMQWKLGKIEERLL